MTTATVAPKDPKTQLRKSMGFWDVLLFNIATVLGPRWIAAAGHNGSILHQPLGNRGAFLFRSWSFCNQ